MCADGCPRVRTITTPLMTLDIISVITNGDNLVRVMRKPFRLPNNAPISNATMIASTSCHRVSIGSIGQISAVQEAVAPIERSIPSLPPITTVFCAMVAIARRALVIKMLLRLLIEIKPFAIKLPMTNSPTIAPNGAMRGLA